MFDEYRQVLGAEKIRTILIQRGHQVSAEYISQLMREMGLSSVRSTAKKEYLKLRETERKKNILQQQFTADQPNQRWVSDVTCFKLRDHYFYICVIIDLFSRKVIAHKISKKNSTQLLTATFKMAHEERHPPSGLIFHSDRGAQYTSHRFQQLLHKYNTKQSFSQPGKPHDNAVAESSSYLPVSVCGTGTAEIHTAFLAGKSFGTGAADSTAGQKYGSGEQTLCRTQSHCSQRSTNHLKHR